MSRLFQLRHPFFRSLLARVLTTVFVGGWTVFEVATGSIFWAIVFGAITVLCIYEFFIVYDPVNFQTR